MSSRAAALLCQPSVLRARSPLERSTGAACATAKRPIANEPKFHASRRLLGGFRCMRACACARLTGERRSPIRCVSKRHAATSPPRVGRVGPRRNKAAERTTLCSRQPHCLCAFPARTRKLALTCADQMHDRCSAPHVALRGAAQAESMRLRQVLP